MSNIADALIVELIFSPGQEIQGTRAFAQAIGYSDIRSFVRQARKCQRMGFIQIIPGRRGRGKKSIYRLNRNSPGYRRKVNR